MGPFRMQGHGPCSSGSGIQGSYSRSAELDSQWSGIARPGPFVGKAVAPLVCAVLETGIVSHCENSLAL